jgi:transposase
MSAAPTPRSTPPHRTDSQARPGIEPSKHLGRHRYVIERRLEWTTRFRRLIRRYEREASHYLGFLRLACALICFRRADRLNL